MGSIFSFAPSATWPPAARLELKRSLLILAMLLISQALGILGVAWWTSQPFHWSTFLLLSHPVAAFAGLTSYRRIVAIRDPVRGKKQYGLGFLMTVMALIAVWFVFFRWDLSSRKNALLLRTEVEKSVQALIGPGRVNLSSESLFVQVQRPDFDDAALRALVAQTPLLDRASARFFLLDLSGTKITDEGLQSLASLHHLEFLYLDGTKITTDGLKVISQMPKLQVLSVRNTAVPLEHLQGLQQARPRLQISPSELDR